ncbi:Eco57I restriction-modification methylase domain-containing protein [Leptotrichia wadei]|jgi:sfeI DNA methyltransferase|uniref:Eco57I restriction-modification methylase domain-containing protein n=1 Tax=Leptotrichia wadei TaxID=157687 RepID=UPI0028D4AEB4|nr:Eco57I restriction-modification methylase domain-containing protein [Leptotrichia wadei]
MNSNNKLTKYKLILQKLRNFNVYEIENGIMYFYLSKLGYKKNEYISENSKKISLILNNDLDSNLETIIDVFENLIDTETKSENGMVFTPYYIAEYICKNVFSDLNNFNLNVNIIDSSCGCGIFLFSAIEILMKKFKTNVDVIIENNIFGIDINEDNVRRTKLILKLISAKYGGDYKNLKTNIVCDDGLICNWNEKFNVNSFNYIIGNPPYINSHNLNGIVIKNLKDNFETTKKGVTNIFYAFIEYATNFISSDGKLGYIIPNNFLTIKSAYNFRSFLTNNKLLDCIIDFGENMIFKPIRTYNCILILSKKKQDYFLYSNVEKTNNIEKSLNEINFDKMKLEQLDNNGWKLVDKTVYNNIKKIESNEVTIKDFIRTGIATLRDSVYLVEKDESGYYKKYNGKKIYIEKEIIKPIYKVSKLKLCNDVNLSKKYIIFPYVKENGKYILMKEKILLNKYPKAFFILDKMKDELNLRDKGKGSAYGWYAYGRTQGLNKYGKKLLFPTFSDKPKFTYIKEKDSLFCNGYAVFENNVYELEIIQKILNSDVMDYYIKNTSYSIEGGYFCYQKKYVENFSIPKLNQEEINFIKNCNIESLNKFLWIKYNLK